MSLQRRSPLKRTPFARKPAEARHAARSKPLARGTATLKRSGQLARTAGLKARSPKMAKAYRTRADLVAAMLAAEPWCLIQWDEDCQGRSVDVHEPGMRSRGADITDPDQCVVTCRYCHDQVHANPQVATLMGWLVPSGRPSKATPRHAAVDRA